MLSLTVTKPQVRFVITGTQTGDLPTPSGVLHASGRKIKVDGVEYFTFNSDGKVIDLLTVEDLAGMMRQLTDSPVGTTLKGPHKPDEDVRRLVAGVGFEPTTSGL